MLTEPSLQLTAGLKTPLLFAKLWWSLWATGGVETGRKLMAVMKVRVGGEKATGHKSGIQSHNTFGWTLAEVLDGGYLYIYVECQRKRLT